MISYILALCLNLCLALAASRTTAPSGALVVSKAASSGQYSKIQDAVNALSTTSTTAQSIFIEAGTYDEQVYVPARKAQLTIYGYSENTSDYAHNTVTITSGLSLNEVANDDLTATLRVWAQNFKLYNVNVVNSYGSGKQALALSAYVANQGYYACKFVGYQDTVLAETGAQVYAKSYIEGATDFIFGQRGQAWFSKCDIRVVPTSYGTITASGRTSADSGYYVLDHCDIAAKSGSTVTKGAYYLGRPWGDYARVAVQSTTMSNVINAAGWHIWASGDERVDHVTLGEYGNSGAGASGTRSYETKLSKAVAIGDVLGSSYTSAAYYDSSYF